MSDAKAVAEAGAFCIVVEGVMEEIADKVTQAVQVPMIGIGASPKCDGQVLVTEDMLGLFERTPRFVKRYADMASEIGEAVGKYAEEVRARAFPTEEQTYRPKGRVDLGVGSGILSNDEIRASTVPPASGRSKSAEGLSRPRHCNPRRNRDCRGRIVKNEIVPVAFERCHGCWQRNSPPAIACLSSLRMR